MASRFPNRPFRVSLFTTACERVRTLESLCDEGMNLPEVVRMARDIREAAHEETAISGDFDALPWFLASACLAAVHAYPYVSHPDGVEQFQPVAWTLRHGGNCEDLSCLYAVLARRAGLPCRLVWINQPGARLNHVIPQVHLYGDWYWAESSIAGAMLGEDPYDAATRLQRHDVTGTEGMTSAAAWPSSTRVTRNGSQYVIL